MPTSLVVLAVVCGLLVVVAVFDRLQKRHTIISNFPIVGRFRFWFEALGGPLRQYIVTGNDEERPFSRDQRRWVYASSKKENNYFGFGTDNDLETTSGYIVLRHAAFPVTSPHEGEPGFDPTYAVPAAKVLGGARGRKKAFRPASLVNTSAMSFGSLSAAAVESINRGVALAGALQNTGEGGIAPPHRHGGELVWQLGTGYFGCRDAQGRFSLERLKETLATANVRALELKLSQGAKPGLGGVLPAAKVTPEIAKIRGIPLGKDCVSPASHSAFHDVSSMLDFIEQLADATGLPVGIKSAVGQMDFWHELAKQVETSGRAPDFITIDGGEGGTGAAPLAFSDHVSLPFKLGFTSVYRAFAERGVAEQVVFIGSGKLGFPEQAMLALALGCDLVNVAREALLAIGCIQAQQCHTGHCPTGIATQRPWLAGGLDPTLK
jgi:glutamate synthase (ferredoxin)